MDLATRLAAFDLDRPRSSETVIDALADLGRDHAVRSTGGRYFGFVTGGTEPTALAASVLASVWDQNIALPVMSPLASAIDERCVDWLLDLLGLPATATASFCSGASVANLTAVITARDALLAAADWDTATRGLAGAPSLTAIVSAEIHVSALKALRLAGIGTDSIVAAPVDGCGRIDVERLPPIDGPTLVVTQAGNVNTGHVDPVGAIVDEVAESTAPVWVHVDGAFGLWAAASPGRRHLVDGVERADSWATDCHKWLNVPYDCGLVAVADGRHLRATMATDAAYLGSSEGVRSLMHLGLQMSQPARAIPVWATLAALGRNGVAELVDRCCDLAARFAARLDEAGATILAPVVLNQVLVSFGPGAAGDATTDAVIDAVARSGRTWMGGTTWQGRRAMRISVSDIASDEAAVDAATDAVLGAWAEFTRGPDRKNIVE
ncbi:MAG: pyridoxal-dependent decarboxylase [Acidimicrobiia bacterium]|nr:pyridoxal-dependent decarboxylase [Acidimicrobiia bacterium]